MAVRYRPLLGPDVDLDGVQEDDGPVSPLLSPTSTSHSRSTTSTTGLASPLPSPTPSNYYLTLADQTFTPLSMDGSDFCCPVTPDIHKDESAAILEKTGLLRAGAEQQSRLAAPSEFFGRGLGANNSTAPVQVPVVPAIPATRGRGATMVSAMVQSFEALQAARGTTGYHVISTKNTNGHGHRHHDPGLVSPPSTVSPSLSASPSPSRSSAPDSSGATAAAVPAVSPPPSTSPTSQNVSVGAIPPPPTSLAAAQENDKNEKARSFPTLASGHGSTTIFDVKNPLAPPSVAVNPAPPISVAESTLFRPTPVNSPPHTPQFVAACDSALPPIVRTSSTASLALSHPTPDPNKGSRSGGYLGNIAALEASAERLSMTSSIEDAIREEHNELKRSDSRRSSILRANSVTGIKTGGSDSGSIFGQSHLPTVSTQTSIVGLNTAARLGGYSPGGYIMDPNTSGRLRSASKASSLGVPSNMLERTASGGPAPDVGTGEDFPFMSRHGPGKESVRSVSSKLSFVQVAELEPPSTLSHALDEADRAAVAGDDHDDDDTIRASAYQHIEAQFADRHLDTEQASFPHGFTDDATPRFQLYDPGMQPMYQGPSQQQQQRQHDSRGDERPTTSGSVATYEQAQTAFGDFDGVHCDPDAEGFVIPEMPELLNERSKPLGPMPPRPKSYFDSSTGQEMLFYPAPVPAMLNLPPKLSKKPKAAVRNMRRSQLLNVMPQESRQSRVWLPDPTENLRGSSDGLPLMTELMGDSLGPNDSNPAPPVLDPQQDEAFVPSHARQTSETSTIYAPAQQTAAVAGTREIRRPQRLTEPADKRKTRASALDGLPPQLRASAFFDLPATTANLEIKGGSASATLDSILDASAAAPVSAFTDHVFAGKLGSEVYGPEKKKKKQKAGNRKTMMEADSAPDLLHPEADTQLKKRASHFSLLPGKRGQSGDVDAEDGRTAVGLVNGEDGMRRDGTSPNGEREPLSPNELAPGSDEESSEEEEEEDEGEEELYQGPPTTLLAELQLRKQQNKMRTRPMAHAYTNGMHSTLLELDAVAEVERKARVGKRVNLAWEDPSANPDHNDDGDDDDVPLGMLAVAKANGINRATMDISAVMSEVHRPLGLMERRELEDNEPLSRRRERLQGHQSGLIPPAFDVVQQRISQLGISPYGLGGNLGTRSQSRLGLPLPSPGAGSGARPVDPDEEEEEETLAERKARLAAENPLPVTRPVSGQFTSELLSQFGGDAENETGLLSKAKGNGPEVPEEEETLGQRRRRLQAEREAREREMGAAGLPLNLNPGRTLTMVPNPINMDANRLSRRMSMADVLGAHPLAMTQMSMDPREEERLRREAEAARAQRETEMKMAAMRAQMPTTLVGPSVGARTGGYMGGMFNDGSGGNPNVGGIGLGYGAGATIMQQPQRMSAMPGAYGGYGAAPMNMNAAGYGAPVANQGHADMVERWRQGVMP